MLKSVAVVALLIVVASSMDMELPFRCEFQEGFCGMVQPTDEQGSPLSLNYVAWQRTKGSTPSSGTGPKADRHGDPGGYYAYLEASNAIRERARLLTRGFRPDKQFCISFWYHMRGSHIQYLSASLVKSLWTRSDDYKYDEVTEIWRRDGNMQSQMWSPASVVIDLTTDKYNGSLKLLLEASSYNFLGDVAIDNVMITNGSICPIENRILSMFDAMEPRQAIQNQYIAYCDFNQGPPLSNCPGFRTMAVQGNTVWVYNSGQTPSQVTGPKDDVSGGGQYIYFETSYPTTAGDVAVLTVSFNDPTARCLGFSLYMKGNSMGKMDVFLNDRRVILISYSGDQGDKWITEELSFTSNQLRANENQINFVATAGLDWQSDFALDNIYVSSSENCGGVQPPGACSSSPCQNGGVCIDVGPASYSCQCQTGYSGTNCDTTICVSNNPCQNGGTCIMDQNEITGYRCVCTAGFGGLLCNSSSVDPCATLPCQNGGQCIPLQGTLRFCSCINGFSGDSCEVPPQNPCDSSPCLNSGTCSVTNNGFQCTCQTGFSGPLCEVSPPIDQCTTNPCLNDGLCVTIGSSFQCSCSIAFTGQFCETPVARPCDSSPCQNNGRCDNFQNTYQCTCILGYSGMNCEVPPGVTPTNICSTSFCLNGGTCVPLQGVLFACQCTPDFTGQFCESPVQTTTTPVPNPCGFAPCANGGTCTPTQGGTSYICQCMPGFTGNSCQTPVSTTSIPTPCVPNPCLNGGSCLEVGQSFFCACPFGFLGDRCQTILQTSPPNICDPNPCFNGGTCFNNNGAATCLCPLGYTGQNCQDSTTTPTTALTSTTPSGTLQCPANICQNNGTCSLVVVQNRRVPQCSCTFEFCGYFCERRCRGGSRTTQPTTTEVRQCFRNFCLNGGTCIPTGSQPFEFRCVCLPGFTGILCRQRTITTSAPSICPFDYCQNGATCVPGNTQFAMPTCLCPAGFTGTRCEFRLSRQCLTPELCQNGGTCIPGALPTDVTCVCTSGFTGLFCQTPIIAPPLQCPFPAICLNGATCIPGVGTNFTCQCPSGFSGQFCENGGGAQQCLAPFLCLNGGTCVPGTNPTEFSCQCASGFSGQFCQIGTGGPQQCIAPFLCLNGATCIAGFNQSDFTCQCASGFTGRFCEIGSVQPQQCFAPGLCLNGATCIPGASATDFRCQCARGYTGLFCESATSIAPTPQLQCFVPDICQNGGTCVPGTTLANFTCQCTSGYTGAFCQTPAASCIPNPCQNAGVCVLNSEGLFGNCICPPPFSGQYCQNGQGTGSLCSPNPCRNNGECFDFGGTVNCVCSSGFTGSRCEIVIGLPSTTAMMSTTTPSVGSTCVSNPCRNGGICSRNLLTNSFECSCPEPFVGVICERKLQRDLKWSCDFNQNIGCDVYNAWLDSSSKDWTAERGSDPLSPSSGPLSDHSGAGYYMRALPPGSSGSTPRQTILYTPLLPYDGNKCLTFFYHMFGIGVGSLRVFTRSFPVDRDILRIEGNQGNMWRKARVQYTGPWSQIGFSYQGGSSKYGVCAIDEIELHWGYCWYQNGDSPPRAEVNKPVVIGPKSLPEDYVLPNSNQPKVGSGK